jgi:multiple antibiotic resistance protein
MRDTIVELVRKLLLVVGALFPIVNSPENIPVFLDMTSGSQQRAGPSTRHKIAVDGFTLLIVSVMIGTHILAFFGISLPVVQVGGGQILVAVGWQLLNQADDKPPAPRLTPPTSSALSGLAFYPLTMPLTVGPGSISVAIAVGANRNPRSEGTWILLAAAVLGCAILALTIYLLYRFAEPLGRVLGDTAMSIIIRLSSSILVCIGVQIVWNGVSALLQSIPAHHG